MPRRRPAPVARRGVPTRDTVVAKRDGDWHVRPVAGAAAAKDYRCPGCSQLVVAGTPHVVVWPVEKALLSDAAIDERRHWHTPCWTRHH